MPLYSDQRLPRPFLKWAGGKTQLLDQFAPLYPAAGAVRRYIEPFVGSGAVFFQVRRLFRPDQVILADSNEDLMNVYTAVRDRVEEVIHLLGRHKRTHSQERYYQVRAQNPRRLSAAARAARTIYLNKTCFNGLYRVNSRGQFNVPMGRYADPPILDEENLRAASKALSGVALKVADFRQAPAYARQGDFIYFDPPYRPLSSTSFFTSYTRDSFGDADQADLAEVFAALHRKGCRVMLSNSDCPMIRRLYREFDIRTVLAHRSINSRADRRGRIAEVAVLNYGPPADSMEPGDTARPPKANQAIRSRGIRISGGGSRGASRTEPRPRQERLPLDP